QSVLSLCGSLRAKAIRHVATRRCTERDASERLGVRRRTLTSTNPSSPPTNRLLACAVLARRGCHADRAARSAVVAVGREVRAYAAAVRVGSGARARAAHAEEISAARRATECAVGLVRL